MKHENIVDKAGAISQNKIELLLSIAKDISGATDVVHLLTTVRAKAASLIDFDDTGILLLDKKGNTYRDLSVEIKGWDSSNLNNLLSRIGKDDSGDVVSHLLEIETRLGKTTENVIIENWEKVFEKYRSYYFRQLEEVALKESLVTSIINSEDVYGTVWLNSYTEGRFGKKDYAIFKLLCEQIGVAVVNLLSKEALECREREALQLNKVSEAIARIDKRQDLLKIIYGYIKEIFPFDNAGLFTFDQNSNTFSEVLDEQAATDDLQSQLAEKDMLGPFYLDKVDQSAWIKADGITIRLLKRERHLFKEQKAKNQFESALAWDLKVMIGGPLLVDGKKIGAICFNSKSQNQYNDSSKYLFQQISNLVAIALSKIIATEEIIRHVKEKNSMLEISEEITSVKERNHLFQNTFKKVSHLIPHDEVHLVVFNKDRTTWVDWAVTGNYNQISTNEMFLGAGLAGQHKMDSLHRKASLSTGTVTKSEINEYHQDSPFYDILMSSEIEYHMYTPLRYNGDVIGILWFDSNSLLYDASFYSNAEEVARMITLAVVNIISNEELERRNLVNGLQLEIHRLLSGGSTWNEKWFSILKVLQPNIPFTYFIAGIASSVSEKSISFELLSQDEYRTITTEDFLKSNNINWDQYQKMRNEIALDSPAIFNGEGFNELSSKFKLIALIGKFFKVHSNLFFPLPLSNGSVLILSLFHKLDNVFTLAHINLLNQLSFSLKLSLDKELALEEIESLNNKLQMEKGYLMEEVSVNHNFEEIIGVSDSLHHTLKAVKKVSNTEATVLIEGETGTGKELIARAIHYHSNRKNMPLIKVNCAALPANLIESELFGHEKGAFTGAIDRRVGKFELAHNGTLFLDEIGELPLELQPKLLRAIQEREIERLGGKTIIPCNVRLVVATNRNLEQEVSEGRFRADLFYRVSVYPIKVPPLRDRSDDCVLLADHFAKKCFQKLGKKFKGFGKSTIAKVKNYAWPGNIRELQNIIEQASIYSENGIIDFEFYFAPRSVQSPSKSGIFPSLKSNKLVDLDQALSEAERLHILNVLRNCNYKVRGKGGAAEILDVHPNTLESRLTKLGIQKKHVRSV